MGGERVMSAGEGRSVILLGLCRIERVDERGLRGSKRDAEPRSLLRDWVQLHAGHAYPPLFARLTSPIGRASHSHS
jgi:hypothetical protein